MASLAAIGIVSGDIAASCRFYRALGVDLGEPDEGDDHFEATLPNGLRLMFDTEELIRRLDPAWKRPTEGHAMALAFECASAAEVDETHAKVVGAGFTGKAEPFDAFWGQRYATVVDPDGNSVDLFAPL
jgi:catechol 2,3-dioxygenase-like lactoylglutathione lyase family enzyme